MSKRKRIVIDSFRGTTEGVSPIKIPMEKAQVNENANLSQLGVLRHRRGLTRFNVFFSDPVFSFTTFRNAIGQTCVFGQVLETNASQLEGSTVVGIWGGS